MNTPTPRDVPAPTKPVTIQDIANALGIHKTTVSKAMTGRFPVSPALREKILAYAAEVNYEPDVAAQQLTNRDKSHLICLCSGSLVGGLTMEKMAKIQTTLINLGFEVPFYTATKFSGDRPDAQISLFRQLRRLRPQAIICAAHSFQDAAFAELERYQKDGGTVVAFDLPIPLGCDQVIFDRRDNAYRAARHLLERGHRALGAAMGQLVGPRASNLNTTQNLRIAGFQQAVNDWRCETGESVPEPQIFEMTEGEPGGAELARRFAGQQPRPTALYIANDHAALGFASEIQRLGLQVPHDVSLIGAEDQPMAAYLPVPLTSVSQPIEQIVQATVDLLTQRLQNHALAPRTVTVCGQVVERHSVAPAP